MESAPDVAASNFSVGPSPLAPGVCSFDNDYLLVGGGLQNSLIALAVLDRRPDARLVVVEREGRLGGNHTWCFHESDVPERAHRLLEPLVVERWPAHDVVFPAFRRRIAGAYLAITSQRLHEHVGERLRRAPNARRVTASARAVGPSSATLSDGQSLSAELVIDARGPEHTRASPAGYQKFVGLELELEPGSAPELPLLMDATVPQLGGFRFMYVLPWSSGRALVEDTYYTDDAELDAPALRERILAYAEGAGMRVRGVLRQEQGVLPIPSHLAAAALAPGPLRAGYAGGLFHPTTGYSLPLAVRLALFVADRSGAREVHADFPAWLERQQRQVRYCLLLNRLLFGAFAPAERYHVLQRFYRLPEPTIRRFYSLELSRADQARILCGRPPVGFSLRRLLAGGNLA